LGDSPFGAGWSIAGVQQLVENADGSILLFDGAGHTLLFDRSPTTNDQILSPAGDFSRLEKVDGLFQRTMPDQTVFTFNADNRLVGVRDRNNRITHYSYEGGQLVEIVDPTGLTTRFEYTDATVLITDPMG